MASRAICDLDPRLQPLCNQFLVQCLAEGINAFITCTYRSNEEQDADYQRGRTVPGSIITNARAGQSAHNCTAANAGPAARAYDFAIKTAEGSLDWDSSDGQWQRAIHIGESLGLSSGSCWKMKDNPHFELKDWASLPAYDGASTSV